jgi:hypothetical protein
LNNSIYNGKNNLVVGPAFGSQPIAQVASSLLRWPGWLDSPKANSLDGSIVGLTGVLTRTQTHDHRARGPHGGELVGGVSVAGGGSVGVVSTSGVESSRRAGGDSGDPPWKQHDVGTVMAARHDGI